VKRKAHSFHPTRCSPSSNQFPITCNPVPKPRTEPVLRTIRPPGTEPPLHQSQCPANSESCRCVRTHRAKRQQQSRSAEMSSNLKRGRHGFAERQCISICTNTNTNTNTISPWTSITSRCHCAPTSIAPGLDMLLWEAVLNEKKGRGSGGCICILTSGRQKLGFHYNRVAT
jgi:hypothetical protein